MISLIISTIRSFCFSQAAKQARIYLRMGAQLPGTQCNYCPKVRQWKLWWQVLPCSQGRPPAKGTPKLWWPVLVQTRVPHPQEWPLHQIEGKRSWKPPKHINHSVGSHLKASTPQPGSGGDQGPPCHPCCDTQSIPGRYQWDFSEISVRYEWDLS